MKNSVLAIAAACALALVACGDDKGTSAPVTHGSLCASAPKLTKDCLVGEWKISEMQRYNASGVEQSPEDLGGTSTLTLSDDFTFSYLSGSDLYGGYSLAGAWSISADSTELDIKMSGVTEYDAQSAVVAATVDSTSLKIKKSVFEVRANSPQFKYEEHFSFVAE